MPTINANRVGSAIGAGSGTFSTARQSNADSVTDNPTGSDANAIQHFFSSGRGGGTHKFRRLFIHFDTSSVSATPQDAVINIAGSSNTSADIIVVKSNAMGADGSTALATSEFFSSIDYTAPLSSEITSWSTGSNSISLNATALSLIGSADNLTVVLVEHDSDFQNTAVTSGTVAAGVNFGTTITLGYTAAASGYGHKVSGVAAASISKVNTVATASIGKVNTVD
tara:strand:- start:664 stop:1338 length:675 start_codon:yes stop_codon:yes gene_type:complete